MTAVFSSLFQFIYVMRSGWNARGNALEAATASATFNFFVNPRDVTWKWARYPLQIYLIHIVLWLLMWLAMKVRSYFLLWKIKSATIAHIATTKDKDWISFRIVAGSFGVRQSFFKSVWKIVQSVLLLAREFFPEVFIIVFNFFSNFSKKKIN